MTDEMIAEQRLLIIRILMDAMNELDPDPASVKKRLKRIARRYELADMLEDANLDDITKDILHRRYILQPVEERQGHELDRQSRL